MIHSKMVKLAKGLQSNGRKVKVLLLQVEKDAKTALINLTRLSAVIFQISSPKSKDKFFWFRIVLRHG